MAHFAADIHVVQIASHHGDLFALPLDRARNAATMTVDGEPDCEVQRVVSRWCLPRADPIAGRPKERGLLVPSNQAVRGGYERSMIERIASASSASNAAGCSRFT